MISVKLMRWSGVFVAAAGAVLMGTPGPLSVAWTNVHSSASLPVHVDWLLLAGIVAMISGGLLFQISWKRSVA